MNGSVSYAGQDPMQPPSWFVRNTPAETVTKNVEIDLQQVLIAKDRKVAVINNKVLREGDFISGMKVLTIERNRIRVRQAGKEKYISLLPVAKEVNSEI